METKSIDILRKLKCILIGGDNIPQKLVSKAVDLKLPIRLTYGSTEMASQITTTNAEMNNLNTCGSVLPNCELKLADNDEVLVSR